jgi:hypothetical protein
LVLAKSGDERLCAAGGWFIIVSCSWFALNSLRQIQYLLSELNIREAVHAACDASTHGVPGQRGGARLKSHFDFFPTCRQPKRRADVWLEIYKCEFYHSLREIRAADISLGEVKHIDDGKRSFVSGNLRQMRLDLLYGNFIRLCVTKRSQLFVDKFLEMVMFCATFLNFRG